MFVPGSSGAPVAFMTELLADRAYSRDVHLLTTFVPGINALHSEMMHASATITGLFMQSGLSCAQRDGRFRALPLSYAGFVRHLRERINIDLAVLQVSMPDDNGQCSLGPSVEFAPVALTKSRRRLALLNRNTPALKNSVSLPYTSFDYVCEVDSPLPTYETAVDESTLLIARHIASLVEDHSVLQLGLGKVPSALSALLIDRRGLRLYSGMLSDGLFDLADGGALDMDFLHTACVLVGSQGFYRRLDKFESIRVVGCDVTHDEVKIGRQQQFVAVNSALEVDLFGQCNLEHADGLAVSGVGGGPDFARGARLSRGGRSIVALSARHKSGSRIVASLGSPSVTSLPRYDIDYVITEYGIADLVGASVHERAHAIINIAAPDFREELGREWNGLAARL